MTISVRNELAALAAGGGRHMARTMSLGVVSQQRAKKILQRVFTLAETTDSARDMASLLNVILSIAKLELDADKSGRTNQQSPLRIGGYGTRSGRDANLTIADGHRLAAINAALGLRSLDGHGSDGGSTAGESDPAVA